MVLNCSLLLPGGTVRSFEWGRGSAFLSSRAIVFPFVGAGNFQSIRSPHYAEPRGRIFTWFFRARRYRLMYKDMLAWKEKLAESSVYP